MTPFHGAVIGRKKNKRIVRQSKFAQAFENSADLLIHSANCGVIVIKMPVRSERFVLRPSRRRFYFRDFIGMVREHKKGPVRSTV